MKGVIESNRADHNAAGLPVYAHHPLPEDFAEALLRGARQTPLNRLLAKFELSVRPQIEKQFAARALLRGNTAGPAFEEHQRQESASRIERHAEGSPTSDASGMSEESRPFRLLGGDEGDGGGVLESLRVPQKASPPPTPRPKPGGGQGDMSGNGDCDAIRKEHADIRRAIADYKQRQGAAERQLSGLLQQRNSLLTEQREVSAALAEARSRSTDPQMFLQVCPSKPEKGRPPRKPDGNEVGCALVGPIITDEAEQFWKRRLEDQKARDIARLEAELRAFPERSSKLDRAIGAAQATVDDAKDALHHLYLGLTRVDDSYKSQCGNPRELWPY